MNIQTRKAIDYHLGGFLMAVLKPVVWGLGLVLKRPHDLEVRGRLCVVKLLGGGSLVIAYPALLGLRRRYPAAEFTLVTAREIEPFARTLGVFDRIDVIDDSTLAAALWTGARSLARNFRTDTVIDLEVYSRLTSIFSTMTAARNRIGFYLEHVFWRQHLHTHLIFFNRSAGSYYWYAAIARLLGAEPASMDACRAHLRETLELPEAPVRTPGRIAIGHACSGLAAERMLTPQQWLAVFRDHLKIGRHAEVALLGSPADRDRAERIIEHVSARVVGAEFANLCGTLSLRDSLRELDGCETFWGVDSSLLHYARLLGLKCVSYWGPTDPATRLAPIPGLEERVYYQKVACSPCVHVAEQPPCRGNNICIQSLFGQVEPNGAAWLAWGQGKPACAEAPPAAEPQPAASPQPRSRALR
jgi:ADP-heptose:LPS heptosyltransferase